MVKLVCRLRDRYFVEHWKEAIEKLARSTFARGDNDRGWRAHFDWFTRNDDVIESIMEGRYDGGRKGATDFDRRGGF
jgi:hypothetical protein